MTDRQIMSGLEGEVGTIPLELLAGMTGLEQLQAMLDGKAPPPPIAKVMNMMLSEVSDGRAVFRGIPLVDHYNPMGSVHGGWAATVMDSALGCCVHTKLPPATGYGTVEFKVNLVRPITKDTGECICEGRVVHFGKTIATSEATLKTLDGKLLAHGTETCAIFPMRTT